MMISHDDALDALHLINAASRRSGTLLGYRRAAPHLVLWSVIYALGYGFAHFHASEAALVWLTLAPAGIVGDVLIVRQDRQQARGGGPGWRFWFGLVATLVAFIVATEAVMAPRDPTRSRRSSHWWSLSPTSSSGCGADHAWSSPASAWGC